MAESKSREKELLENMRHHDAISGVNLLRAMIRAGSIYTPKECQEVVTACGQLLLSMAETQDIYVMHSERGVNKRVSIITLENLY